MSTTREMLTTFAAALAVDHGGGFDLSATGAVMLGLYDAPHTGEQFVSYWPEGSAPDEWMDLRNPSWVQRIRFMAWNPAANHTPAGRMDAALAMQEVVSAAITGIWIGSTPPPRVRDWRLTLQPLDPALSDLGITSHGVLAGELSYRISGEGGRI